MALLVVLPLILATATALMAAQQNIGNISLPGCPTKCGSIYVPYPFGFLPGCYRPGFQLTCNTSGVFIVGNLTAIEVTFIPEDSNQLYVSVPYIVSAQDGISRDASWATALVGTPYTISSKYNMLTANGCGVVASLLNLDTGATVASCASFCGTVGINTSSCDIGFGCCSATIPDGLKSYSIRLDSQETESGGGAVANTDITAELLKESTRVEVVLDWGISDAHSCEDARRDRSSYACSDFSRCINMAEGSIGYICDCVSILHVGNPYVPNSCPEVVTLTTPETDCPRKCGDIDVPFPFGIRTGCYRHENFRLDCNMENRTPVLRYQGLHVTQIKIREGRMCIIMTMPLELDDTNIYFINNITAEVIWMAGLGSCQEAKNRTFYPCISTQSECIMIPTTYASIEPGYNCKCRKGYDGNPYIHGGCQDVDECSEPHLHGCYGTCTNTPGSFTCSCELQMDGNSSINCSRRTKNSFVLGAIIGISIGLGLILLLLGGVILHKRLKQSIRQKIN